MCPNSTALRVRTVLVILLVIILIPPACFFLWWLAGAGIDYSLERNYRREREAIIQLAAFYREKSPIVASFHKKEQTLSITVYTGRAPLHFSYPSQSQDSLVTHWMESLSWSSADLNRLITLMDSTNCSMIKRASMDRWFLERPVCLEYYRSGPLGYWQFVIFVDELSDHTLHQDSVYFADLNFLDRQAAWTNSGEW